MSATRFEIHTERLHIVPLDLWMAEQLTDVVIASRDHIGRWMRWVEDASLEAEVAFIRGARQGWDNDLMWAFAFFFEDRLAGGTGLTRHGVSYLRRAEMGYWISRDLVGRGLTTESAAAVAHFGFEVLGLHRLELHASPGNDASHRVAEKIGFRKEGYHREATMNRDGFLDTESYGLLATDPRLIPDPLTLHPVSS